ncbi:MULTISPECIES: hypothetical protein [unclassified Microbacterium]|uniref:hypothetical protein n=1 Tax=unclassified Microbacterium TaxID=2609290 RepID=UPI00214AD5E2|nr:MULTISPECIES: hypothetical protein [unclassified Microbacterium]MCR2785003.1 hypothetical protein [Microbacterium sp. zg.B96]WIM16542.1 hypothetical protein QNO11_02560 [Microbacterium sp. zg-B96]
MVFSGIIGALRRRWYVALLGLIVTAGMAAGAMVLFPPTYTARGLVLLIPPVDEEVAGGSNPFLALGGLDLPARVLVASYSSNAAQEEIAQRAPGAVVTVSIEESTRGPVIAIDVIDASAEGALDTLAYVAGSIPATLTRLQQEVGAPADATATSIPLAMDTEAETDRADSIRIVILAAGAGLALTVLLVLLTDRGRVSSKRRRRRSGRDADSPDPTATDAPILSGSSAPLPDTDESDVVKSVPADPRPAVLARSSRWDEGDGGG